jgi:hypothetical protein
MTEADASLHGKHAVRHGSALGGLNATTKHDSDHVVILSAEEYDRLRQARMTGSLTEEERALIRRSHSPVESRSEALCGEVGGGG